MSIGPNQFFPLFFMVMGIVVMLPALWLMLLLNKKMPFENLKSYLKILNTFSILFVLTIGITAYAILNQNLVVLEWLVGVNFLLGAIYVFSVGSIISKTVNELKNSEFRNKLMVEEVKGYAIILLDVQGNVLTWSKGAQEVKGFTAEEIIGQNFANFYTQEDIAENKPQQLIRTALEHGRAEDEGFRAKKDGSKFWGSIAITALRDEKGEVIGFSKVTRDFTERKNAEDRIRAINESLEKTVHERTKELQEINSELNTYAYTIAHDLQSPLRVIIGFSGLLLKRNGGKLEVEAQEWLNHIHDSARRMSRLITALLDFSNVGKDIYKSKTDMTALATENKMCGTLSSANTKIVVNDMPPAYCDPVLMGQVWHNLICNAVKYSALKPNPMVEIGCVAIEGRDVYYVRDNGVGFDMQYAGDLFGVFKRMHTDEEFEGTGIGLATVHKIIARHGGKIWAEATKDVGACFYFYISADIR